MHMSGVSQGTSICATAIRLHDTAIWFVGKWPRERDYAVAVALAEGSPCEDYQESCLAERSHMLLTICRCGLGGWCDWLRMQG